MLLCCEQFLQRLSGLFANWWSGVGPVNRVTLGCGVFTRPRGVVRAPGPGGRVSGCAQGWGLDTKCVWRRCPTLPHPGECSTIGAGRLSFRVRNGTGRFPAAMTTVTLYGFCVCMLIRRCGDRLSHSGRKQEVYNPHHDAHGEGVCVVGGRPLVPVSFTRYQASTSGLSTPWSVGGLTQHMLEGEFILKQASRLDAFSGYPFRT